MTRLLALSLLLAACAAPSDPPSAPQAEAPPEPVPPAPPGPDAKPPQPWETDPHVDLIDNGLGVQAVRHGPTYRVDFGTPLADAVASVSEALGEPDSRSTNQECGAGPIEFINWPDFAMLSLDGQFDGWTLSDRTADATSIRFMDGIGIGSTRAEVDAAGGEMFAESTLGDEFMIGDVSGMLDAPDGRVTDLWAGLSCTFR